MRTKAFLTFAIAIGILFSSCNKNLTLLDNRYFKTTPNPLEVKAGEVDATITGTFPEKYFNKKAVLTVTPILKYGTNEAVSDAKTFQGEKVQGNDQTINYKSGGTFTLSSSFDYVPEMNKSELILKFKVNQKGKTYQLPDLKIADGVVATSQLTSVKHIMPAIAPNSFERITKEKKQADILFLIQESQLRNSELNKDDIKLFNERLKVARNTQNQEIASLEVLGYASPDGPIELNTNLAEKRQAITTDFVNEELKKLQADVAVDSRFTAEDWEGFRKLMEASDIQDKELILRVLSMYQDPEQREREIKNLASTFKDIEVDILPQLRRSRLNLTVDMIGRSDDEIANIAAQAPKKLAKEELLYAATLTNSDIEKARIYEAYIDLHPNDARGYNNLGIVRYNQGIVTEAEGLFKNALEKDPNAPDVNFNLGLMRLAKGQINDALAFLGKSAGTTGNLSAALGNTYIQQGDYEKAENVLQQELSNDAALVQILNKDYNKARTTLSTVTYPDATTAYLNAIVAARTNNRTDVYSYLKKAIRQDKTMAKKALNDLEFSKYLTDTEFLSIVK